MYSALVNKIIPFSAVDGPGNRMALFLQECNFNCLYCHNPETINRCIACGGCISSCPVGALNKSNGKVIWDDTACIDCDSCISVCRNDSSPKTKEMTTDNVMVELLNILPFISGITISGGECSLQSDFIGELFKKTRRLDSVTNFLDTNGYINLKSLSELYRYLDKAMVDLKAYDNEEHIKLTGKGNKTVIDNIIDLAEDNKLYEVRTVIVPDILDNINNVDKTSKLLSSLNPYIRYKLIKYRNHGVRSELITSVSPDNAYMDKLKEIAEKNGCKKIIIDKI